MLRRSDGFRRYAIAVQYYGRRCLGFPYLGKAGEDCLVVRSRRKNDNTNNGDNSKPTTSTTSPTTKENVGVIADLRGYHSVEGRLRRAFNATFGKGGSGSGRHARHTTTTNNDDDDKSKQKIVMWENLQVSSRTDRGVHAIRNTFHVDIYVGKEEGEGNNKENNDHDDNRRSVILRKLQRGINFHLARQKISYWEEDEDDTHADENDNDGHNNNSNKRRRQQQSQPSQFTYLGENNFTRTAMMNDIRILSAVEAPEYMDNSSYGIHVRGESPTIDYWHARYSATQRTYMYRILCYPTGSIDSSEFGYPFEYDRSWIIRGSRNTRSRSRGRNDESGGGGADDDRGDDGDDDGFFLDMDAMKSAASMLIGTHDFSSFRATKCQRQSPIVTLTNIDIQAQQPYGHQVGGIPFHTSSSSSSASMPMLITIEISGTSFVYRQVRNMVGCLVEVGRGKLTPTDVQRLLEETKNRSKAPYNTAPAHGLYLVDVQHGDFHF